MKALSKFKTLFMPLIHAQYTAQYTTQSRTGKYSRDRNEKNKSPQNWLSTAVIDYTI